MVLSGGAEYAVVEVEGDEADGGEKERGVSFGEESQPLGETKLIGKEGEKYMGELKICCESLRGIKIDFEIGSGMSLRGSCCQG